jgi:hypothetical protein
MLVKSETQYITPKKSEKSPCLEKKRTSAGKKVVGAEKAINKTPKCQPK